MDLRQASGVPLPAADVPVGTVSVRVVRGSFANNLTGVDVTFDVNGKTTTMKTDAAGRVQIAGLAPGTTLKASAVVDGERLESQSVTIGTTGIRFVLVASGGATPEASNAPAAPAAAAVRGSVTIGPESRIVADYAEERLTLYYVLQVLNRSETPVDLGGPLVIELPQGARGAGALEGATKQATIKGATVTVLGPFAPGVTSVNIGFELPFSGAEAHIEQRMPAPVDSLTVFTLNSGGLDMRSPQFTTKRSAVEQGQPLVVGFVPALKAGETLTFDVTGLPHYAVWPRNVALGAATLLIGLGLWGAILTPARRRSA
jgi:hypothetical protein